MSQQWQLEQIAAMQYVAAIQLQTQRQMSILPPLPLSPYGPELPPLPVNPPEIVSDEELIDDDDSEEKRTLFCANLDERVTEELLYEIFLQAGPVQSAKIPKDTTGKQRTFGFVTFVHRCTPLYAIELLQGLALFRRALVIKFQGNTNPPSQRRSLPADCEVFRRKRENYDSSSSHRNSYPSYADSRMNDSSGSSVLQNPFKQNIPDWTQGSAGHKDNDRIAKHSSTGSRSQHRLQPYERAETSRSSRNSHDRDRGRQHHQKQQPYHDGGSRRSEQRSNQRR